MTVQDLIDGAFRMAAVIDAGEGPSSSESDDALETCNGMLGNWSTAGVPVVNLTRDAHTLSGAASYTIGTGATINVARPLKIRSAAVVVSNVSRDLKICTVEEWTAIRDRSRAGKFAKCLLYDAAYPTGTIYLSPTPASGGSLELWSVKAITEFASLGATVDLPPGYVHAIKCALAFLLAIEYGRPLTDALKLANDEAKSAIATLNAQVLGVPTPAAAAAAAPAQ